MQTLILTPLEEEFQSLLAAFTGLGYENKPLQVGRLNACHIAALDFTLARGGHGKTQFGVQTQHLVDHLLELDMVICAGAAGGLDGSLQIGDLVVATETVEHDYNLKFSVRPQPRFQGAAAMLAELHKVTPGLQGFNIHFGIVASGDEDVIEAARAHEIHAQTGALAVAWEGAGGARACAFNELAYLEIRGLTDTADNQAPVVFDENLKLVMPRIAALLTAWVENR